MEKIILDLLEEIKQLKASVLTAEEWMHIQINMYKEDNAKLHAEVRTLLIQANILVNKIKQQEKQLKANKFF